MKIFNKNSSTLIDGIETFFRCISYKAILDNARMLSYIKGNKTRQGYARKRILKQAGSFFLGQHS